MLYHYKASDSAGRIIESDLEADSLGQILQNLAAQGLRPVSVEAPNVKGGRLFGKITLEDKIFLTKYLALMLRVGTDLLSAINILIADFEKPAMRNFLVEVRNNLMNGRQFYQAFANHPEIFSLEVVSLVKAAEESGNLQQTFEDMSGNLSREADIRSKVKGAMIYPIILLAMSIVIVLFLVTFALPKIARVFNDGNMNPPVFSKIVFTIGLFINDHIVAVLLLLGIIAGPGMLFFTKTRIGRSVAERVFQRLPLVSGVRRELAIQRFAGTFSSLLKAGMPIIKAVTITAEVVGSEEFRMSLVRIADEGLAKGLTVGEAFKREPVFPKVVTNLIAISEKGGHLEEVLQTIADFYASNVEGKIKSLVAVLEPLMLLAMGVLVGTIALSIIIPIYQLSSSF